MFNYNFQKRLVAATPLIALLIFLFIGFGYGKWAAGALAFLLVPLMPFLVGLRKITITFPLIVFIAYMILGFGFSLWHPGWIIFLLVPIYSILVPSKSVVIVSSTKKVDQTIDVE